MSKKKVKKYLPETHPHLLEEWDYAKNGNLRPEDVTYGVGKKVWWVCTECRHEWRVSLNSRTSNKRGCPACSGHVVTNINSLSNNCPGLVDEWDYEKNEISPDEISYGSHKKVWWKCSREKCGYKWLSIINNRATKGKGCPECFKEKIRIGLGCTKKEFAKQGLDLLEDKYISITTKMSYLCKKCGHRGRKRLCDVKKGQGCLKCVGREKADIVTAQKDFDGLGLILLDSVYTKSLTKMKYQCKLCRYQGDKNLRSVRKGRGCPQCGSGPISKVSQEWLDSLNVQIREYSIKEIGFRVDGFDPETNTVYEFFGDYWHGNPDKYDAEDVNSNNKKSFGMLHKETLNRLDLLDKSGYKVIYIWESDFTNSTGV